MDHLSGKRFVEKVGKPGRKANAWLNQWGTPFQVEETGGTRTQSHVFKETRAQCGQSGRFVQSPGAVMGTQLQRVQGWWPRSL